MTCSHGYGFREGALLDIHDYAVPAFPVADDATPPAEPIRPLLRKWIIPRVLQLSETLREAYGA